MIAQAPTASLSWFAAHEMRLAWRDWMGMMAAGKRSRERTMLYAMLIAAALLHGLAYMMLVTPFTDGTDFTNDKTVLVILSVSVALAFCMMLSQALEGVTRVFYARGDLDLILSSPASASHIFIIKNVIVIVTTSVTTLALAIPFINMAIVLGGPAWAAAYLVLGGLAVAATGLSLIITIALFNTLGAKRTRLAAQIIAAVMGASLLIGIQIASIMAFGDLSRFAFLTSVHVLHAAPDAGHWVWWPVHALQGNLVALAAMLAVCIGVGAAAIAWAARGYERHFIAAAGVSDAVKREATQRPFKTRSSRAALRAKEWTLLKRDPWLVSQTAMQIFYLVPPAFLLWHNFGDKTDANVILAPVLVMAFGQLAGGLSWLAISGEDAPDLVATAPIGHRDMLVAKIQAVLAVIALFAVPLLALMALTSPIPALVTAVGIAASATAAIAIQFWYRSQAKRAMFRRRQVASKAATLSEAFSSIMWAGTACLAAAGWIKPAVLFAGFAMGVVFLAYTISPAREAAKAADKA
ncbi:MAG: permease [Pseudomonadota bacterium]